MLTVVLWVFHGVLKSQKVGKEFLSLENEVSFDVEKIQGPTLNSLLLPPSVPTTLGSGGHSYQTCVSVPC